MLDGKKWKKRLLMGLLGGMLLTVSACGREALDMGKKTSDMSVKSSDIEKEAFDISVKASDEKNETSEKDKESVDIGMALTKQVQADSEVIVTDISDKAYDALPVLYSLDNASRIAEPQSVFSGDWDKDGTEDTLTIITEEQQDLEIIQKLELALSGCPTNYLVEDADCDFIDILSADFDGDKEAEILLLFDMRYAGANGCCGLQFLDKAGEEYVNLADGFFTGFDYTMKVQTGEDGGYQIVNDKSGKDYSISVENPSESAIAQVTGWYHLEILKGEEKDYLRLKQYVAGEDMTDHVGDMVMVLSLENKELITLEEKCMVQ